MVIWMHGLWKITKLWGWILYGWGFCCLIAQSCLTLAIPWIVARQAPLSMGFSRQEDWSGLPFPFLGDLPDPGIELVFPALAGGFLTTELPGKPTDVITALLKGTPENILTLFPMCEVREKIILYKPGSRISPTWICQHLYLRLLRLKNWEIFVAYATQFMVFLLKQPKWKKTWHLAILSAGQMAEKLAVMWWGWEDKKQSLKLPRTCRIKIPENRGAKVWPQHQHEFSSSYLLIKVCRQEA